MAFRQSLASHVATDEALLVPLYNGKFCLWIHTIITLHHRGRRRGGWFGGQMAIEMCQAGLRESSTKHRTAGGWTHMGSWPEGRYCFRDRKRPWVSSLRLFSKANAEWKCSALLYIHSAQPQEGLASIFLLLVLPVPSVYHGLALRTLHCAWQFSH